jgi:molybdopterin molybdotransferase
MISVTEADHITSQVHLDLNQVECAFDEAVGKVLAEDIKADRDFPPFNRVSMDGIAIEYKSFQEGQREFKIQAIQAAGSPQLELEDAGHCIEVMTGAVLPANTDTVIRYEDLTISDGVAKIEIEDIRYQQNNHKRGTDRKKGDIIIATNTSISGAEIGIIASAGYTNVKVYQAPRIAIISTGEELVDVAEKPLTHQIRKSNVHSVHASLKSKGLEATLYHLPDHRETIETTLAEIMLQHQVLILSGGVSKGKFDFLPDAFKKLGVEKLFHKIKQRPGKPFWFGKKNNSNVVFAFPGNPVSTFMCLHRYFFPWIDKQLHIETQELRAVLTEDFTFKPNLQYFLQVKTSNIEGTLFATPITGKGSGDLANLTESDGFLELQFDKADFKKGETFPYIPFR